jgi:SAM-dependent methyltransferase
MMVPFITSLIFFFVINSCRAWGFASSNKISLRKQLADTIEMPFVRRKAARTDLSLSLSRDDFLQRIAFATFLNLAIVPNEALAMMTDPKTGINLPSPGEIEESIPKEWRGVDNPFESNSKALFGRLDSSPDSFFYKDPRFVEHVDENVVALMTDYISSQAVRSGDSVLDLCSSWTSHIYPYKAKELKRVAGLGMNANELKSNPSLVDWVVQDLNENPVLPYNDASFDTVLCQLSIDYLTRPLDVLRQVGRVLKPGGKVHILFSNRLFLTKAVGIWTGADDLDHAYYAGCYLHFCNGGFGEIEAKDLSMRKGWERRIVGDPLYVVTATRTGLLA